SYEVAGEAFVLEGTHNGFAQLPEKPCHVRRFEVSATSVTIRDRIEGSSARPASIGFLLHPACEVELAGRRAVIRREGVTVVLECSAPSLLEEAVWWPDMGVEIPTHRLRVYLPSGDRRELASR